MPFFLKDDEDAMNAALAEAEKALDEGEVPIGCVIVHDGAVVGRGHNQVERLKDATAHAEIVAIGAASTARADWRLEDCTLFTTLEPCTMCAGAIVLARVGRVVYGAHDPKAGACGSVLNVLDEPRLNHQPALTSGVLAEAAGSLLSEFFELEAPAGGALSHLNVELKARCADPSAVRTILEAAGADFHGVDAQRDVYFRVPEGRLKLRRGTIERSLIYYRRADDAAVKPSFVTMARLDEAATGPLEEVLTSALGVRNVVEKRREIRFVGNVKFHLDEVPGLGAFVEIEAIESTDVRDEEALRAQCEAWRMRLGIASEDLIADSYGDLVSTSPRRHP